MWAGFFFTRSNILIHRCEPKVFIQNIFEILIKQLPFFLFFLFGFVAALILETEESAAASACFPCGRNEWTGRQPIRLLRNNLPAQRPPATGSLSWSAGPRTVRSDTRITGTRERSLVPTKASGTEARETEGSVFVSALRKGDPRRAALSSPAHGLGAHHGWNNQ